MDPIFLGVVLIGLIAIAYQIIHIILLRKKSKGSGKLKAPEPWPKERE